MSRDAIGQLLRGLGEAADASGDCVLLDRLGRGDHAAFGVLVRRYGRLVWSVCRGRTPTDADADDAFQATFLVLLRSAGRVSRPECLPGWLYGVAAKVCARARRSAERRADRERRSATAEGTPAPVADSLWDRTLSAVHEAAETLPEPLRVVFVLCCLEGVRPTDAAERLGWKLGTVTGRLARARKVVLDRLSANGLGAAGLAGLTPTVPPKLINAAAALAGSGRAVSAAVARLAQGAVSMTTLRASVPAVRAAALGRLRSACEEGAEIRTYGDEEYTRPRARGCAKLAFGEPVELKWKGIDRKPVRVSTMTIPFSPDLDPRSRLRRDGRNLRPVVPRIPVRLLRRPAGRARPRWHLPGRAEARRPGLGSRTPSGRVVVTVVGDRRQAGPVRRPGPATALRPHRRGRRLADVAHGRPQRGLRHRRVAAPQAHRPHLPPRRPAG